MTVEQRLHDLEEQLTSQKLVIDTLLQNLLNPALMVPGTLRFGGNVMELGNNGVQILSKATGKNAVFFFDDKFQVDPNTPSNPTGTPYSVLIGYVSRSGSPPGSQISMDAVAGTATGELTVTASNDTNDEAVTQSYVNVGSDLATVRHEMSGGRTFAQLLLSNTVLRLASFTSDPSTLGDGDIWYRSDLDKVYLRANGATVELSGGGSSVMPVLFGTESVISLGSEISASAATRDTSFTWPAANRRIYVPITITEDCTVVKVWWVNGAAVSGNVDFTLYTEAGVRTAITSGSTAQSGTTVIQEVNTADTALTAGRYYMSLALDNATGRISGYTPAIETVKSWGVAQEASAFTAPATATLAAAATAYVPTIGMSLRTLVA